jgi:hypothetical protein
MAKFAITENEFIDAMTVRQSFARVWLSFAVVLVVVGTVCYVFTGGKSLGAFIPVFLLLPAPILAQFLLKSKWRRLYRRTPSYRHPIEYSLDEAGCTITSPTGETQFTWDELHDVKSTDRYWFLFHNEAMFRFLPVAALSGEEVRILREVEGRRGKRE